MSVLKNPERGNLVVSREERCNHKRWVGPTNNSCYTVLFYCICWEYLSCRHRRIACQCFTHSKHQSIKWLQSQDTEIFS